MKFRIREKKGSEFFLFLYFLDDLYPFSFLLSVCLQNKYSDFTSLMYLKWDLHAEDFQMYISSPKSILNYLLDIRKTSQTWHVQNQVPKIALSWKLICLFLLIITFFFFPVAKIFFSFLRVYPDFDYSQDNNLIILFHHDYCCSL